MKIPSRLPGLTIAVTFLFCQLSLLIAAQDVRTLSPVSRSYAIVKATVIQGPGRRFEGATVLIKDGLITSVGKDLQVPPDATIVKGDSLFVYAGFIDGLSRVGVNKPREDTSKEKPKDPGNPPAELAGITPYQDARNFLNPVEKSIEEWRALGFTTAQVVPYGGMLPGYAAIIFYNSGPVDKMIASSKSALYSELQNAERMYPNTILGVLAKWKELFLQASQAKSYAGIYVSNKNGLESPGSDRVLEAFYPVIDKQIPVIFKSEKNLDAQRILSLKAQLGFNAVMAEVKEGWDLVPKLKSANAKVFLSLDLPEDKKDKDKENKDKKKDDQAIVPDSLERKRLEDRRDEFIGHYVGQAATYQNAGMPFGFSTLSAKPKDVPSNLRRMIKAGLTEDAAIAALTINAAQALGLADRLGTIDQGKIANLVVSRRSYFDEKAKVVFVFVEGKLFKIDAPKSEKPEAEKKAEKP